MAVGYWFAPMIFEYNYVVPIYVIFIGLIQYFKYKNNKLFIHKNFIIKQNGAWDVSNAIIDLVKFKRLQRRSFWHKN
jgi:putative membrane protein